MVLTYIRNRNKNSVSKLEDKPDQSKKDKMMENTEKSIDDSN